MPRSRAILKIVDLAASKGGTLQASDPDLEAIVGTKSLYRLPSIMWAIRKKLGVTVTPIRQGRKVVAYTFPGTVVATVPVDDVIPEVVETPLPTVDVESPEETTVNPSALPGGWSVTSR